MKPGIIITIIGSVAFIAIMLAVKEGAKAVVDSYGAWIAIPIIAIGIAFGYWIDRRKKPSD